MLRVRVKAEVVLTSIVTGDLTADQLVAATEMYLNDKLGLVELKTPDGKDVKVGVRFHFQEVVGNVNW